MRLTTRDFFILWAIITLLAVLDARGQMSLRSGTLVSVATGTAAAAQTLPSDISNLYLWYKADAGVLNGAGSSASSGETVGTWQDQSGNNRHAYQTTGSAQPLYQTGVKNSKPGVYWGSGDYFTNELGATVSQPFSFFAVASNNNTGLAWLFSATPATVYWNRTADNKLSMYAGTALGDDNALDDAKWLIVVAVFNGSSSTMFINGTNAVSGNAGTGSASHLIVGNYINFVLSWYLSYMPEFGMYNKALSGTEITNLTTGLNAKWSIY